MLPSSDKSAALVNNFSAARPLSPPPLPMLPPEILLKVLSHLPDARAGPRGAFLPRVRNGTLFSAALVNKTWSALALDVLYSSVQVLWTKSTGELLLDAFRSSACRVRHLDAHFADAASWDEDWTESKQGRERALDARARWPEDAPGALIAACSARDLFCQRGAQAARKVSLDADWIDDREKRQLGFGLFWMWVAELKGLVSLDVSAFDRIMTRLYQKRLAPVFASLRHVALANDAGFALAILRDAETLILSISDFGYNPDLYTTVYHLKNVQRIKISWGWGWGDRARPAVDLFQELDPARLIAVDVRLPDPDALSSFISILPHCTSLQSLTITTAEADYTRTLTVLDTPAFRSAVAQTTLAHLTLSAWPTATFLSSLPPTLRSLVITEMYVPESERGEFGTRLDDARGWRARYLPALKVLAIQLSSQASLDERNLEARLAGVVGRARGFAVVVSASQAEIRGLPGQWNA